MRGGTTGKMPDDLNRGRHLSDANWIGGGTLDLCWFSTLSMRKGRLGFCESCHAVMFTR